MNRVYLDHAATSPIRREAADAVAEALRLGANASSVHAEGRRARMAVEDARARVADGVNAPADGLVFTSGATEALNLAIHGGVAAGATQRLLVSAIEHDATLQAARTSGAEVEVIPVTAEGVTDVGWLEQRLARWDAADGRPFVALMLVNNETGVIQPVEEAGRAVRAANGLLLVDAVQALGKIPVDMAALGANYIAISAHKIGGPAGVGALALAEDAPLARRVHGGGQERGRRAGTENLSGIAGLAAAVEAALCDLSEIDRLSAVRDRLESGVKTARPDALIVGDGAPRVATITCLALEGFGAETQVMAMDLAGVAVSAGAACSSGKVRASHVLAAMGAGPEIAGGAIRASLGWNSRPEDADRFVDAWVKAAERAAPARATA